MSSRRGFNAWLIVTLVSIFLGMLFILLHGTGVIKNWGKRGQEQEAEVALYKALVKLDQGKMGDLSGSFPAHEAGRVAKETYQFLRSDLLQERELTSALAGVPTSLPKDKAEAERNLQVLKQALLAVDAARDDREIRSGKLMLVLRGAAKYSDRLQARYFSTERDFTETDNLYGGPERIIELQHKRLSGLIAMHQILLDDAVKWTRTDPKTVMFDDPNSKDAMEFQKLQAMVALDEREIARIREIMRQTVAAERESMRRRLGL